MPDVIRRPAALLLVSLLLASLALPAMAMAASVSAASFSGGAGTAVVGGTLFARNGASLSLSVTTDAASSLRMILPLYSFPILRAMLMKSSSRRLLRTRVLRRSASRNYSTLPKRSGNCW